MYVLLERTEDKPTWNVRYKESTVNKEIDQIIHSEHLHEVLLTLSTKKGQKITPYLKTNLSSQDRTPLPHP